jgi:hypothetical protein
MGNRDYAFVGDERTGIIAVHRADCPVARQAAADGKPVMTLIDCEVMPPMNGSCAYNCKCLESHVR